MNNYIGVTCSNYVYLSFDSIMNLNKDKRLYWGNLQQLRVPIHYEP